MGILLVAVVFCVAVFIALRAQLSGESESGNEGDSADFSLDGFDSSGDTTPTHSTHHHDAGCGHSHDAGCDFGGHGGFDGGHGGFDSGGHH
jgi:hypothetical protein